MIYEHEIEMIKSGMVGVIPTDTIYGLVCSAFSPVAVEKIYHLKNRALHKPLIVLISNEGDLNKFGIQIDYLTKRVLKKYWPGPVTIILPCNNKVLSYIHRGTQNIAFRLPKTQWLAEFLHKTGPLVAPSANPEGQPPANNIEEAKYYFGEAVNFYIDGGTINAMPSKILTIVNGHEKWIR